MMRFARILTDEVERVAAYLPDNYRVAGLTASEPYNERDHDVLIKGSDVAGWTLDDYVLPRLASGLMFGNEEPRPPVLSPRFRIGMTHGESKTVYDLHDTITDEVLLTTSTDTWTHTGPFDRLEQIVRWLNDVAKEGAHDIPIV